MIQIYHNPKCSTSREGLEIMKDSGKEFEIIEYMKNPVSVKDLKSILRKLNIQPIELIRKKEKMWKENYDGKKLSGEELIRIMAEHPNLIERPIVIKNEKAVIGRPPSLIKNLL
jgi:arsenate reductase